MSDDKITAKRDEYFDKMRAFNFAASEFLLICMNIFKPFTWVVIVFCLVGCESAEKSQKASQCKKHYQAESYAVAARVCQIAAEKGDMNSQWLLANLHLNKLIESASDTDAAHWLSEAANNAHTAAQRELGLLYWRGRGVEQDADIAMNWFRLAARQKDTQAQFYIGVIYLDGAGEKSDPASALTWFKRAATNGHKMAINNIAWIYATSDNPSLRNGAKAVKLMLPLVSERPDSAVYVDTLAAAYAETRQFELAVEQQQKAIGLLSADAKQSIKEGFVERLNQYNNKQPWRETGQ